MEIEAINTRADDNTIFLMILDEIKKRVINVNIDQPSFGVVEAALEGTKRHR